MLSQHAAKTWFIQQLAAASHLGSYMAYYQQSKKQTLLLSLAFLLVGLTLSVWALYRAYEGFVLDQSLAGSEIGCLALLAFFLVYVGIWDFARRNEHVTIYEQGLVQGFGSRQSSYYVYRWQEVETIYYREAHVLHLPNGKQVQLGSLQSLQQKDPPSPMLSLAERVEERFVAWHLQAALAQLRSGQEVCFDSVFLSGQGIRVRQRMIPWQEIKRLAIEHGVMRVTTCLLIWEEVHSGEENPCGLRSFPTSACSESW
jgi:hypothetical protein